MKLILAFLFATLTLLGIVGLGEGIIWVIDHCGLWVACGGFLLICLTAIFYTMMSIKKP